MCAVEVSRAGPGGVAEGIPAQQVSQGQGFFLVVHLLVVRLQGRGGEFCTWNELVGAPLCRTVCAGQSDHWAFVRLVRRSSVHC